MPSEVPVPPDQLHNQDDVSHASGLACPFNLTSFELLSFPFVNIFSVMQRHDNCFIAAID